MIADKSFTPVELLLCSHRENCLSSLSFETHRLFIRMINCKTTQYNKRSTCISINSKCTSELKTKPDHGRSEKRQRLWGFCTDHHNSGLWAAAHRHTASLLSWLIFWISFSVPGPCRWAWVTLSVIPQRLRRCRQPEINNSFTNLHSGTRFLIKWISSSKWPNLQPACKYVACKQINKIKSTSTQKNSH